MNGIRIALVACMAAALAASCGSGSDEPEDPQAARQKFVAEADALCAPSQVQAADLRRRAQEIAAQQGSVPQSELTEQAARLWADQIALAERFRDDFQNLEVPPGDEELVGQLRDALSDGIDVAHDIHAELEDGEEPSPTLIQDYAAAVERGNAAARAYGFSVCGRAA